MPITSSRGWLGVIRWGGLGWCSERIILWLNRTSSFFELVVRLQSGFRALHGFKVCSSSFRGWVFEHQRRVCSWLRTNAGGVLNTCKSNGDDESLLLSDQWRTGE